MSRRPFVSSRYPLFALPAVFLILWSSPAVRADGPASQPSVPDNFMRFVDDGKGGGSLQTADVAFKNKDGVEVHLVGAIHIGEKSYYESLNKDFKTYDAVLYEMVKAKDAAPPAPGEARQSTNPISKFQRFLNTTLDLDYQLDDINYTAANFVHADMDAETFEQMQEQRGETFEQLMMRQILKNMADPPKSAQMTDDQSMDALISILTRPDMERQIKVILAKQMGEMDDAAMGLDGPNGSVIVTERNKTALKVLADTLQSAKKKKIAIFYGAAHMQDMSKRLADMGFKPTEVKWNPAWDLTIRQDQPSMVEKLLRNLMDSANGK